MTRKRKLDTLSRADLGKQISFTCICQNAAGHVEGIVRSFAHGVYSDRSKGEVDVPLVLVSIYAYRSHESHWATPATLATLTAPAQEPEPE